MSKRALTVEAAEEPDAAGASLLQLAILLHERKIRPESLVVTGLGRRNAIKAWVVFTPEQISEVPILAGLLRETYGVSQAEPVEFEGDNLPGNGRPWPDVGSSAGGPPFAD